MEALCIRAGDDVQIREERQQKKGAVINDTN